ncbi:MAG: enoyl-CoA hydratase [Thermomicrobiales bacterium]|jgi:enoyl-CoA hydratase|nr:enoyl-CoA hydratase [Thermomicrobiales bacterium]
MAVDVEREGSVAIVTMNRPEALNAFNSDQLNAMLDTFRSLRTDRDVRCVVLTGAGERAFAAGADIKEMVDKSPEDGLAFGRLGHAAVNAIEGLPQPVIAAVNGFAIGGGSEVALACDIRLASENAVFAQPEVGLGIPPGWGATQRLTRLVGPGIAAELILTGRRVKANEALRIGLVNAVYPLDQLLPEAIKLAQLIATNSPRAVMGAKRLMQLAFNGQIASGLETEVRLFGESFGTADQREGMGAFVEKRTPVFTGE